MLGMSVVTFSPGHPYGCWMNWYLKSSMRTGPRGAVRRSKRFRGAWILLCY